MKRYLILLLVLCSTAVCFTQYRPNYAWAIGFRAGSSGATSGLTIKGFLTESVALEGVVGYWHGSIATTLLVEKHVQITRLRSLYFYAGGGAHFTGKSGYNKWYIVQQRGYTYANGGSGYGVDGVIGLEYKIPVAPVAFSLDLKPMMEIGSNGGFAVGMDTGLSVKLAF